MPLRGIVTRVRSWLHAGYPQGVPDEDVQPLFGVLSQRMTNAEILHVVDSLIADGVFSPDRADVGVAITKVIHELPGERDMQRVRERLERVGFPVCWPEDGEPDA